MSPAVGIILNGAAGRMGRAIAAAALEEGGIEICAAVERSGHPALGADLGTAAGYGAAGVTIVERPERPPAAARVLVDFTEPSAAVDAAGWAARNGLGVVIGTTGLTAAQQEALRTLSGDVPMIVAPNMSLGVNLLFRLVAEAARVLGPAYDVEVVEAHHRGKKDAPSGTARRIVAELRAARGGGTVAETHGRRGDVGPRPAGEIGVHAVRGGDIVGDHTVIFAGPGERIELSHRATSRDAFARGVLAAARFAAAARPAWYSMADVLGLG